MILVKKLSLVGAAWDASVVWVWPGDCPSATAVTGPEGHIQESDLVLTAVRRFVEGPICFLGQPLGLRCGGRGPERRPGGGADGGSGVGKNEQTGLRTGRMLQWGVEGDPQGSSLNSLGGSRFWLAGGSAVTHLTRESLSLRLCNGVCDLGLWNVAGAELKIFM